MREALTIGGVDSSGGAGVGADLRTFASLGVHGCCVVTCITAQTPKTIENIYQLPVKLVSQQLETVLRDVAINSAKTGMLYSPEIVQSVAKILNRYDFLLVVDPVMKATVGISLHCRGFSEALIRYILPRATLLTPNIEEAEKLTGCKIKNLEDIKHACKKLYKFGCENVLIKGGHLRGSKAIDVLYNGRKFIQYSAPFYSDVVHGTGCMFSALITGFLAKGSQLETAVENAKTYITKAIESSYKIGEGLKVVNTTVSLIELQNKLEVLVKLNEGIKELMSWLSPSLTPEVGINFVYALPNARTQSDVCGIENRIRKEHLKGMKLVLVDFGKSQHIAKIVLTAMKFNPQIRSAMNIKFSNRTLKICKALKFEIGTFDRKKEPKKLSTMEWGTEYAIKELGKVPDIIYDLGGENKEPMIRILGREPQDVMKKLLSIIYKMKN